MARVLLLAHCGLARALRRTVMEIVGSCPQVAALDLSADQAPEVFLECVRALIMEDRGHPPILILTDIYGGTPWRIAGILAQDDGMAGRIAILTGVNLAMVLEACTLDSSNITLETLTEQVRLAAINGICV
jgi:PTS system mannose-specific IIA component